MSLSRTRLTAIFLVVLVLLLWFVFKPQPEPTQAQQKRQPAAKKATGDELTLLYTEIMSAAPEGKKPVPFKTKGRVHLKLGETAVIGFWEFGKDRNGLAMITPEMLPDGTMKLSSRLLNVTDAVAADHAVRDLFPAPFDVEQYGALSQDQTRGALEHLQGRRGADMLAAPSVVTRAGMGAQISVGEADFDGSMKRGLELHLNPSAPSADGSLDLDLSLSIQD